MPVSGTPKEIVGEEMHRRVLIDTQFRRALDVLCKVNLSSEEMAYIAGLFDGEGCVSFGRTRSSWFIRVFVTNTNLEILEWLKSIFGGDIKKLSSRRDGWKQGYCWRISWTRAIEFLSLIAPWSRLKKRQIEIALAWDWSRAGMGQKSEPLSVDLLVRELHWWNQRGGTSDPNPVSEFLQEIGYAG